jgi:hypothetical protein
VSAVERSPAEADARAPVAPWYPPPTYPPPKEHVASTGGGRAVIALVAAIFGIVLGLPLGLPGMILGTLAYFLGKSAVSRMEGTGAQGGRGMAVTAWVLGVVAMAIGSAVSLVWLVVLLVVISGPATTTG